MAHGLLTLVSDSGANNELVLDKKSGLVFDTQKPEKLSNILISIISNFNAYTNIRKQGQARAYSKFSSTRSANNLVKFYKNKR